MRPLSLVWLMSLWACSSGSSYSPLGNNGPAGSGGGSGRGRTGGQSSAGTGGTSGKGAGGSSGLGTSSGGTSSTTGAACPLPYLLPKEPPTDCPPGQVELKANVADYCSGDTINMKVQVEEPLTDAQVVTDDCGYFYFCGAPEVPIYATIDATGFFPAVTPFIRAKSSSQIPSQPGLLLVCDTVAANLPTALPTAYVAQDGLVLVTLAPQHSLPGDPCGDESGWRFSLVDTDGGFVDAGLVYIDGLGAVAAGATATTPVGAALFYNVDPSLERVRLIGNKLGDSQHLCATEFTAFPWQFTGDLPVLPGRGTVVPYIVP